MFSESTEALMLTKAPTDGKIIQARKRLQKEKIKKARKQLAINRDSAPQVSVPVIPKQRYVYAIRIFVNDF